MLRFRRSGGWNPSLGCPDPTWRHSWTSVENAELLERYFTSNPSESSYLQRMWDLRVLRNPAASSFIVFLNLSFYLCILCADKFHSLPVVGNERWWIWPWCWLKQETHFNIYFLCIFIQIYFISTRIPPWEKVTQFFKFGLDRIKGDSWPLVKVCSLLSVFLVAWEINEIVEKRETDEVIKL